MTPTFVLGTFNFLMLSALTVWLAVAAPTFVEAWMSLAIFWGLFIYTLAKDKVVRIVVEEAVR